MDFKPKNTMKTDQEAESLARKIHEKHRRRNGIQGLSFPFDQLTPQHRQGWIETARLFLDEQDPVTTALTQEVHAERSRAEKAEKAEKTLASEVATISKELEFSQALSESLRTERDLAREALRDGAAKIAKKMEADREGLVLGLQAAQRDVRSYQVSTAELAKERDEARAELAKVKHELHHAKLYGDAKAFEVVNLKEEAKAKSEGIEGTLIQAGTLTDGAEVFSGIVLSVPWEALRDAKRMPFYSKVRVVEVA